MFGVILGQLGEDTSRGQKGLHCLTGKDPPQAAGSMAPSGKALVTKPDDPRLKERIDSCTLSFDLQWLRLNVCATPLI